MTEVSIETCYYITATEQNRVKAFLEWATSVDIDLMFPNYTATPWLVQGVVHPDGGYGSATIDFWPHTGKARAHGLSETALLLQGTHDYASFYLNVLTALEDQEGPRTLTRDDYEEGLEF